jgi:ATP-dependent helicase HrpA
MNFRVEDAAGKTIGMSRDLVALQRDLGAQVQQDLAKLPVSEYHRDNITQWDFGDLPERVEIKRHGMTVAAYPAVVDQKKSVSLRLLDSAETARQQTRAGVRRLFLIQLREETRYLARHVPDLDRAAMVYATLGSGRDLKQDLLVAAADRALFAEGEIRTREQFLEKARNGWRYLSAAATEIGATLVAIMQEYQEVAKILSTDASPAWLEGFADVREQLKHLLPPGFIATTPPEWFQHLPRFVKAIRVRLQKLVNAGAARDAQAIAQVRQFWDQYTRKAADNARRGLVDPELERFRWMIEELRVSLFAQALKTSIPISPQRLERQWQLVRK